MEDLAGRSLLVGLTYVGPDDAVRERRQFLGEVVQTPDGAPGVYVRSPEGEAVALPADGAAFLPAPRGAYRCLVSGETITDPDLVSSWRIVVHNGAPPRWQANYAPHVQAPSPDEWDFTYRHDPTYLRRFLDKQGGAYVGKRVRVVLQVYVEDEDGASDRFAGEEERVGRVARASYAEGVVVALDNGKEFRLPPDLSLLQPVPAGDDAPVLMTRWTVVRSAEEDEG